MLIRHINQMDDRFAISKVYEESWKYAYRGIIPDEYLDSIPRGKWCEAVDSEGRYSLVMLDGDKIIGTSSYCASRFEDMKGWGEIISIYLLPEYCSRGLGKQLINVVISELDSMNFTDIFLWVLEDNHKARTFYEKSGFVNSGEFLEDTIGGKTLRELKYVYHIK